MSGVTATRLGEWRERFGGLPGWLNEESAAVWDCLLGFQGGTGIAGNLFEIGVFKGRSATLAWLHGRPGEAFLVTEVAERAWQ